jgi:RimJ/RimL family protein N-acetyltransferase
MARSSAIVSSDKNTIVRSETVSPPVTLPSGASRALVLPDGTELRMRPIRPDDEARLEALFGRLSARTVYQRFLSPLHRLPAGWYRYLANVDHRTRLALVAEDGPPERPELRAVARIERGPDPGIAEIAVVVEDAWQERGLGTRLLDALLSVAEAMGVRRFTAEVLAENRRMLRVIRRLGEVRRRELDHGVLTIEFERRRAAERQPA